MKTVYTCIFSNYEELKDPVIYTEGWRYICFTDQPLQSDIWEIKEVPSFQPTPQLTARFYKIMFHLHIEEEYSFWIDGSFTINCDLNLFWEKHFVPPFTTPAHPLRDCVFQEAAKCIEYGRGIEKQIRRQIAKYKGIVPPNNGIITSGLMMRQKSPEVIDLCERWWNELKNNSTRDQISFALVSMGFNNHMFPFNYSTSQEFIYKKHYHKRKKK